MRLSTSRPVPNGWITPSPLPRRGPSRQPRRLESAGRRDPSTEVLRLGPVRRRDVGLLGVEGTHVQVVVVAAVHRAVGAPGGDGPPSSGDTAVAPVNVGVLRGEGREEDVESVQTVRESGTHRPVVGPTLPTPTLVVHPDLGDLLPPSNPSSPGVRSSTPTVHGSPVLDPQSFPVFHF